eukprot:jgi/Botrbrau1/2733/Bobra.0164s0013.1
MGSVRSPLQPLQENNVENSFEIKAHGGIHIPVDASVYWSPRKGSSDRACPKSRPLSSPNKGCPDPYWKFEQLISPSKRQRCCPVIGHIESSGIHLEHLGCTGGSAQVAEYRDSASITVTPTRIRLEQEETPAKKRPRSWDDLVSEGSTASLLSISPFQVDSDCSLLEVNEYPLQKQATDSIEVCSTSGGDALIIHHRTDSNCLGNSQNARQWKPGSPSVVLAQQRHLVGFGTMDLHACDVKTEGGVPVEIATAGADHVQWQEEINAAALAARALKRLLSLQAERCILRQQLREEKDRAEQLARKGALQCATVDGTQPIKLGSHRRSGSTEGFLVDLAETKDLVHKLQVLLQGFVEATAPVCVEGKTQHHGPEHLGAGQGSSPPTTPWPRRLDTRHEQEAPPKAPSTDFRNPADLEASFATPLPDGRTDCPPLAHTMIDACHPPGGLDGAIDKGLAMVDLWCQLDAGKEMGAGQALYEMLVCQPVDLDALSPAQPCQPADFIMHCQQLYEQLAAQAAQLLVADERIAQLEEESLAERAQAAALERDLQTLQQERANSQRLADTLQAQLQQLEEECNAAYGLLKEEQRSCNWLVDQLQATGSQLCRNPHLKSTASPPPGSRSWCDATSVTFVPLAPPGRPNAKAGSPPGLERGFKHPKPFAFGSPLPGGPGTAGGAATAAETYQLPLSHLADSAELVPTNRWSKAVSRSRDVQQAPSTSFSPMHRNQSGVGRASEPAQDSRTPQRRPQNALHPSRSPSLRGPDGIAHYTIQGEGAWRPHEPLPQLIGASACLGSPAAGDREMQRALCNAGQVIEAEQAALSSLLDTVLWRLHSAQQQGAALALQCQALERELRDRDQAWAAHCHVLETERAALAQNPGLPSSPGTAIAAALSPPCHGRRKAQECLPENEEGVRQSQRPAIVRGLQRTASPGGLRRAQARSAEAVAEAVVTWRTEPEKRQLPFASTGPESDACAHSEERRQPLAITEPASDAGAHSQERQPPFTTAEPASTARGQSEEQQQPLSTAVPVSTALTQSEEGQPPPATAGSAFNASAQSPSGVHASALCGLDRQRLPSSQTADDHLLADVRPSRIMSVPLEAEGLQGFPSEVSPLCHVPAPEPKTPDACLLHARAQAAELAAQVEQLLELNMDLSSALEQAESSISSLQAELAERPRLHESEIAGRLRRHYSELAKRPRLHDSEFAENPNLQDSKLTESPRLHDSELAESSRLHDSERAERQTLHDFLDKRQKVGAEPLAGTEGTQRQELHGADRVDKSVGPDQLDEALDECEAVPTEGDALVQGLQAHEVHAMCAAVPTEGDVLVQWPQQSDFAGDVRPSRLREHQTPSQHPTGDVGKAAQAVETQQSVSANRVEEIGSTKNTEQLHTMKTALVDLAQRLQLAEASTAIFCNRVLDRDTVCEHMRLGRDRAMDRLQQGERAVAALRAELQNCKLVCQSTEGDRQKVALQLREATSTIAGLRTDLHEKGELCNRMAAEREATTATLEQAKAAAAALQSQANDHERLCRTLGARQKELLGRVREAEASASGLRARLCEADERLCRVSADREALAERCATLEEDLRAAESQVVSLMGSQPPRAQLLEGTRQEDAFHSRLLGLTMSRTGSLGPSAAAEEPQMHLSGISVRVDPGAAAAGPQMLLSGMPVRVDQGASQTEGGCEALPDEDLRLVVELQSLTVESLRRQHSARVCQDSSSECSAKQVEEPKAWQADLAFGSLQEAQEAEERQGASASPSAMAPGSRSDILFIPSVLEVDSLGLAEERDALRQQVVQLTCRCRDLADDLAAAEAQICCLTAARHAEAASWGEDGSLVCSSLESAADSDAVMFGSWAHFPVAPSPQHLGCAGHREDQSTCPTFVTDGQLLTGVLGPASPGTRGSAPSCTPSLARAQQGQCSRAWAPPLGQQRDDPIEGKEEDREGDTGDGDASRTPQAVGGAAPALLPGEAYWVLEEESLNSDWLRFHSHIEVLERYIQQGEDAWLQRGPRSCSVREAAGPQQAPHAAGRDSSPSATLEAASGPWASGGLVTPRQGTCVTDVAGSDACTSPDSLPLSRSEPSTTVEAPDAHTSRDTLPRFSSEPLANVAAPDTNTGRDSLARSHSEPSTKVAASDANAGLDRLARSHSEPSTNIAASDTGRDTLARLCSEPSTTVAAPDADTGCDTLARLCIEPSWELSLGLKASCTKQVAEQAAGGTHRGEAMAKLTPTGMRARALADALVECVQAARAVSASVADCDLGQRQEPRSRCASGQESSMEDHVMVLAGASVDSAAQPHGVSCLADAQDAAKQLRQAVINLAKENACMAAELEKSHQDRCSKRPRCKSESGGNAKEQLQKLTQEKQVLKALCKLAVALIIDSLTGTSEARGLSDRLVPVMQLYGSVADRMGVTQTWHFLQTIAEQMEALPGTGASDAPAALALTATPDC